MVHLGLLEPGAVQAAHRVLRGPRRSNALGLPDGTTTLSAALDVLAGKMTGQCLPRHTD